MNKRLVFHTIGSLLLIEAACMVPSLLIALGYGDGDALAMLIPMLAAALVGYLLYRFARPRETNMRAREGFVIVALSWIVLSIFGALPFVISGMLPNFVDAFFEAVSGFTTTGASALSSFEYMPHGVTFWRSFTHWIGGMGILVLTLALIPKMSGRTAHLMRAESPGPTLSKILPKMGDTAKVLYIIYMILTALEFGILILCGMDVYDAAIHAIGTAGTGGFSNYSASVGAFDSSLIEAVIAAFMLLFGVNFALFYRMLVGDWKSVFRNEELRWYVGIVAISIALITVFLVPVYGNAWTALRYSGFQVASVLSTTGFCTTDYNLWPIQAKMLIMALMFIGSCAGSTAGGMKVIRVAMMCKQGSRQILRTFQPRKVKVVRFDGEGMEESQLHQVSLFAFFYVLLVIVGAVLVGLEGKFDLETNLTASLTCISNVGPGLGMVGPAASFAEYGPFAKIVLSLLMLAGRLEIFPILILFHPDTWRKL